MDINSVQMIKTQNIPSGTSTKAAEGDHAFSRILAQIAGMVDGEEMDMTSDLTNLLEATPELIEEEEDSLLFNPMNIPWILMNTSENMNSDQVIVSANQEIVESIDMENLSMGENIVNTMGTVEDVKEIQALVAEDVAELNNEFSLELEDEIILASNSDKSDMKKVDLAEIPMEKINKDSIKSESRVSKLESMSIDKDIQGKEEVSPINLKDSNLKGAKESELDLAQNHIQGFRLEKTSTSEISQEPVVQRNIDFDENIQNINDTIIELMDVKSDGADTSMKVKLNPEELGFVDVTLKMEEGKLVARILVENEQVRELFNNHMNQLNDKLVKQDISISKVEVDLNFNSNQQSNSSSNQNNKRNPFASNQGIISSSGIVGSITSEDQTNSISSANGLNILA